MKRGKIMGNMNDGTNDNGTTDDTRNSIPDSELNNVDFSQDTDLSQGSEQDVGQDSNSEQDVVFNQDTDSGQDLNPVQDVNFEQDINQNTYLYQDSDIQKSTETTLTDLPGKKSNRKLIAVLIAIVILLAGSVTAYANRNALVNTFYKLTKSPTEYYAYVEQKELDKCIDKLSTSYDKSLIQYAEQQDSGVAQDLNLKFSINPQFTGMLGLGNFDSIEAKLSALAKGGNSNSKLGISYNGTSVLTLDTYMNTETSDLYLLIPELSNAYLLFSLDEMMAESGTVSEDYSYSEYMNKVQSFINNGTLSAETLNSLLKKYSSLAIKNIDNVTLDSTDLTASDISNSFTRLTAEINQEDLYNMGMAILNEAKNDQVIKDLCTALDISTEEEYSQSIDDAIAELNNNKETMIASEETVIMNVYVDKFGNIMGREFKSTTEEVASSLGYYITRDSKDFGFTSWVSEDDVNILEITGNATYANNSFTGTSNFIYSEYNDTNSDYTSYSFDIAFENANLTDTTGYINGKYTITSDLLAGAQIVFDCSADELQQKIIMNVLYGNLEAATLEILSGKGTFQEFEFPSDSDEVYDGVADFNSYFETVDLESFIATLEDTLEIENLESYIQALLSGFMY